MAVGWSSPRDDDAEPTTPSTHRIVAGMGFDPASPGAVVTAYADLESVPYAKPDEVQDDVIEPTAVFKPWVPSIDWANCIIEVTYYD